jgi:dihydroorotate dehydrogenase
VSVLDRAGLALLHRLEPERAHALSLAALRAGLVALPGPVTGARLATRIGALAVPNPVGLAAGYDKDAVAVGALVRAGFGFVEAGAVTPRAQPGNPRPRVFRLAEDRAVINRFGFNNGGMAGAVDRLGARRHGAVPVGLNLGANRDSADRAGDFAAVLTACGPHVDFVTVNVSSPNTERLRDLQGPAALAGLLERVMQARAAVAPALPVWLKIAPDLDAEGLAAIAEVAQAAGVDAIVATNTTLRREGLKSAHAAEAGGLSGEPLFEMSTRVVARLAHLTAGRIPIVGVGGVGSAEQAYAKIRAGASAVQLYTALIWQGLPVVPRIARGLEALLARDGHASVADAVGCGRHAWL